MAAIVHSHRAASGLRFNLRVRVNLHKNSGKVQVPLLEAGQPASLSPGNLQAGFAIFSSPGELECSNQWSHQKLDEWLREMLPIAFEYMYEVAKDGGEVTWHLLKASHLRLCLNNEVPNRYDFVDAKGGKSKGWQDSKIYLVSRKQLSDVIHKLEGRDASTSKHSASDAELEYEPELAHRHYTCSKKKHTSKSYTATPIANDKDAFQWSSDIKNAQEIKSDMLF
ncbi:hypothetical protein JB92DRAFT_3108133 [Gautieria morchelliformis]|nr:hypothetical protein JB92DRAFT_3108133 [Gautieria morchelliformis]